MKALKIFAYVFFLGCLVFFIFEYRAFLDEQRKEVQVCRHYLDGMKKYRDATTTEGRHFERLYQMHATIYCRA